MTAGVGKFKGEVGVFKVGSLCYITGRPAPVVPGEIPMWRPWPPTELKFEDVVAVIVDRVVRTSHKSWDDIYQVLAEDGKLYWAMSSELEAFSGTTFNDDPFATVPRKMWPTVLHRY